MRGRARSDAIHPTLPYRNYFGVLLGGRGAGGSGTGFRLGADRGQTGSGRGLGRVTFAPLDLGQGGLQLSGPQTPDGGRGGGGVRFLNGRPPVVLIHLNFRFAHPIQHHRYVSPLNLYCIGRSVNSTGWTTSDTRTHSCLWPAHKKYGSNP